MSLSFRKTCWLLMWVGLFLVATASVAFGETYLLYEKTYKKDLGRPVTYVDRFEIPSGYSDLKIHVTNGVEPLGEVKNIKVVMNGTEIVSNRDMKNPVSQKAIVNFESSNVIEVTLRGQGGNGVKISLFGEKEDQSLPVF